MVVGEDLALDFWWGRVFNVRRDNGRGVVRRMETGLAAKLGNGNGFRFVIHPNLWKYLLMLSVKRGDWRLRFGTCD